MPLSLSNPLHPMTPQIQVLEIAPAPTMALQIQQQQNAPLPLLRAQELRHVAALKGVSFLNVERIAEGLGFSMRRLERDDADGFFVAMAAVLKNCAKTYCGASKIDELTIEEMAVFVLDRFGMYGIGEIELAFSLAASGELGDDVDLKAYYGQFSVAALGGVLNAYRDYRSAVVTELHRLNSKLELAAPKPVFDLDVFVQDRMTSLLSRDNFTVSDFTKFDYEVFVDTVKICLLPKAECFEIWDKSIDAVNLQLASKALSDREARKLVNWVKNPKFEEMRKNWSRSEVLRRWFTGLRDLAQLIERNVAQHHIRVRLWLKESRPITEPCVMDMQWMIADTCVELKEGDVVSFSDLKATSDVAEKHPALYEYYAGRGFEVCAPRDDIFLLKFELLEHQQA
jgi:hypothetical protein